MSKLTKQIQPYSLPDAGRRRRTIDFWLFVAGSVCLLLGFALTCSVLYSDSHTQPKIGLDREAWRVSFSNPASGCDLNSVASATCQAHPDNKDLWSSEITRNSPKFIDRYSQNADDSFWMGLRISSADLKKAAKESAPVLVLPRINGLVQVWVDGVYQATHDFSVQRTPLQISFSKNRMMSDKDLVVAMAIFPYPHQPVPEATRKDSREGFYTAIDADRLVKSDVFFATGPHLIAVALFLLISAFLWSAAGASRTRDFAVGTQLSLVIAMISLLSVDLSFRFLNVDRYESLYFLFLLIECVLIVRYTWTIARGARETSRRELLIILGSLALVFELIPARWIEAHGVNLMTGVLLPLTYGVCALIVGHQAYRLKSSSLIASRTRIQLLAVTGFSLALTCAAYFIESSGQSGFHVTWSRWLNIIMLLGLVRAFAKAFQTKSSLIELSPVSKFHRMDPVPATVDGWILNIEVLKFSSNRQVMSTVLSHLWTVTRLRDGEVIRAEERSIIVFFEKTNDGGEDERLIETLSEMAKCLKDLEKRLPIMFSTSQYPTSVLFRASAIRATLRPAWQTSESGIARLPIWNEVADRPALELSKGLLATDLDGVLRSNDSSVVVMSTEDAEQLMSRSLVSKRARVELEGTDNVIAFLANRLSSKATAAVSESKNAHHSA